MYSTVVAMTVAVAVDVAMVAVALVVVLVGASFLAAARLYQQPSTAIHLVILTSATAVTYKAAIHWQVKEQYSRSSLLDILIVEMC